MSFKSLTEQYEATQAKAQAANTDHQNKVDKPSETEKQASNNLEIGLGFKGSIGLEEAIQEAFYLYMEGPVLTAELGVLAMKNTMSPATVSANINMAKEWGKSSISIAGAQTSCTVTGEESVLGQVALHGTTSAMYVTFQRAADAAAMIPGIDIAG
ncbi:MAG: hypothetical protein RIB84_22335 [Sneathiellaceae bacterium]